MSLPRILRLLPAAAGALAIAACASSPPASQPPAPLHPSRVELVDTQVMVTDTGRVTRVWLLTTQGGAAGQFSPPLVRVRRGDLVRFQMADGEAIHNVSFTWQGNDRRGVSLPADSPMLYPTGPSWPLRIDLPPGTYKFACIVHLPLGMRGTLVVEP